MQKLLIIMLLGGLAVAGVSSEPASSKYGSNIDRSTVADQEVLDLHDGRDMCSKLLPSLLSGGDGPVKDRRVCWNYIKRVYKQADPGLTKFFEYFGPYGSKQFFDRPYTKYTDYGYYRLLRASASDDPKLKFYYQATSERPSEIKYREKFEKAFEELLVKPCKRVLSDEQLLVTMPAITLAQFNLDKSGVIDKMLGDKKVLTLSEQLEAMNWTRELCRRMIEMDSSARTRFFNEE